VARARIYKHLWSPAIDSEGSIPLAYVAMLASSTTNRIASYRPARLGIDSWAPYYTVRSTNTGSVLGGAFLKHEIYSIFQS
jgi:hypothetical protein